MTIRAINDFLSPSEHQEVWRFLTAAGWAFGAYSRDGGSRYFYKHFAGYRQTGAEYDGPTTIEAELQEYPILAAVWERLKAGPLAGQSLARCYANGMPPGAEGGLHLDSNIPSHLTAIYYPHPAWDPDYGGETVFYTASRDDVLGAVYPRPNRLVVFPGTIPHVARPTSVRCDQMRITLMFKTSGASEASG